jgi:hypothetical protein
VEVYQCSRGHIRLVCLKKVNFVFLYLQVLTVVLVILATADLGHSVQLNAYGESVSSADFYSPIIKMATFVSTLIS